MTKNDGGKAFPATYYWNDKEGGYRPTAEGGMSLRDYFIAHAPIEPWPGFEPEMRAKPTAPRLEPKGNNGEVPNDDDKKRLHSWRHDPCFDFEDMNLPQFSAWCNSWIEHWAALPKWDNDYEAQRYMQWPCAFADAMLYQRDK